MIIRENLLCFDHCQIVRDDLLPFLYGGNKARKALEYERILRIGGYDAVVTTGGIQSNHCRVVALLAARNGWGCHIVYHGTKERFEREAGNAFLVRSTNATYEFVETSQIAEAMDSAMVMFKRKGKKPYYVTGGGHDLAGGIAYVKAIRDLSEDLKKTNNSPHRIFLPSGTGSTQAGIIVGLALYNLSDVEVIGISIARKKERAMQVTKDFTKVLAQNYEITYDLSDRVYITDDFLLGGYEETTREVQLWLVEQTKKTGIVFDPTYSGKALWGMFQMIQKNNYPKQNNLFWHTGGIMNVMK